MHRCLLLAALLLPLAAGEAPPIRVLIVGGDWKSQIDAAPGREPLRGHFIRAALDAAAPGRFAVTLWTSYEFLQYGDRESLRPFDAIMVGDVMGQSVLPRL